MSSKGQRFGSVVRLGDAIEKTMEALDEYLEHNPRYGEKARDEVAHLETALGEMQARLDDEYMALTEPKYNTVMVPTPRAGSQYPTPYVRIPFTSEVSLEQAQETVRYHRQLQEEKFGKGKEWYLFAIEDA